MARTPRIAIPGLHHVTARGNNRRALFMDDLDRESFLASLSRVTARHLWICHAFCLMTNHFHALVETPDDSLPRGMQRLNSGYAQSFNRRHGTIGHLFQGRFYSRLVTRDAHALILVRYIARNPVEAGLCRTPEEWPWSSHGAALGLRRSPTFLTSSWLLGLFGEERQVAQRRMREFALHGTRPR